MGEFRIGRRFAQHSYPDTPRGASAAFARNFAQGPTGPLTIGGAPGTQVPWTTIESGAPAGVDVPITPRVTGRVRIQCVVGTLVNPTEGSIVVAVQAQINGTTILLPAEEMTIPGGSIATIPYLIDTTLPVGSTSNVEIIVQATVGGAVVLEPGSTTIDIQELPAATG